MTMPNFLIIGAEKSGTTALYTYLQQHPQVYMSPVKEPDFFSYDDGKQDRREQGRVPAHHVTNLDDYLGLFRAVSTETAIGEASPYYIYAPQAPERIQRYMPNSKLIAILRDPAERAYSNFLHCAWLRREPLTDFAQALQKEEARIREGWEALFHYRRKGFYYAQLRRYFDRFGRDQLKVYLHEDLESDPLGVLGDLCSFLEVDETFVPNLSAKYNRSGVPKNETFHAVVTRFRQSKLKRLLPDQLVRRLRDPVRALVLAEAPQLSAEVRKDLVGLYCEDILQLQDLIQRDLSKWLR